MRGFKISAIGVQACPEEGVKGCHALRTVVRSSKEMQYPAQYTKLKKTHGILGIQTSVKLRRVRKLELEQKSSALARKASTNRGIGKPTRVMAHMPIPLFLGNMPGSLLASMWSESQGVTNLKP
jgi:hypothetical protein